MANENETTYTRSVTLRPEQNDYDLRLRRRRGCPLWLLLLLLPLLLLVECQHTMDISVVDAESDEPLSAAAVVARYTSHYLYADGEFLADVPHADSLVTDSLGQTAIEVKTSVYGYIFHLLSTASLTASHVFYESRTEEPFLHLRRSVTIPLTPLPHKACDLDMVMCIDNTGSMDDCLDYVKQNAMSFYTDLRDYCQTENIDITSMRLRVVQFGDLGETPIRSTGFLRMPDEEQAYSDYLKDINPYGGGANGGESGLEALATAIASPWSTPTARADTKTVTYTTHHIIVLYTDEDALPLGDPETHAAGHYPDAMPANMDELRESWQRVPDAQLILFAPEERAWNEIAGQWKGVTHDATPLSTLCTGDGYQAVLKAICHSL